MKTTLLYIGSVIFLISCEDTSNTRANKDLPDDEMKSLVEVEEIQYEKEIENSLALMEGEKIEKVTSIPQAPELRQDGLGTEYIEDRRIPMAPDIIDSPHPINGIVDFPEIAAQFPGGIVEMKKFIQENIQFPSSDDCIQGTVYISMVIGMDGKIRDAKVMRGGIDELNEEALRLVNSMPNWIPAEQDGKTVAARVRLPIRFTLN